MTEITIIVTTMGFRVPVELNGHIRGTDISIARFAERFEHWEWDKAIQKDVLKAEYFYFDSKNKIVHFPRYALDDFLRLLSTTYVKAIVVEDPGVEGTPVSFRMLPHIEYKNDKQRNAVAYLTNEDSGNLRGIALQTGSGKTVSYIWGIRDLAVRSLTTMTSRLEQWVKEMQAYTTLEEDDLFVIQGAPSLTKLYNQIDKDISPKAILASTVTMRKYLEYGPGYQHLPHPTEMCEKLGIGIVGTDEYHEHFNTNLLMMLVLNPKLFIPITATFAANSPFVKNIFESSIPKSVQFEGGEYDRYVNITSYKYTGGAYQLKPFHYMRAKGYSQVKFEEYLLGKKGANILDALIKDALIPIIREHYINLAEDGEKFLLLCATKDMCDYLQGIFRRAFNSKTVSVFYSGMPTHTLEKFDMILSTPGSAGTGRDIKKLRTCFVLDNTGSEIRNLQYLGRLRGPPQMLNMPEFIYLHFSCIQQHINYNSQRTILYGPRALHFKHRTI